MFRGKLGFLSNFYSSKIVYNGRVYRTAEHLFQCCKSESESEREAVRACPTAAEARRAGRKVTLRKDWTFRRLGAMRAVLRLKFSDKYLAKKLIATGDSELVEENTWHDDFWGVCVCKKCNGYGRNELGKALMRIRAELQNGG